MTVRKNMRRAAALLAAVCVFGAAIFAQTRIDATRAAHFKSELLYLPNAKLLHHFTSGMDSIIADLLWLRCVQYVAEENRGDRAFTWLDQMLDTVIELDPYFTDAYRFGAIFLSALKAEDNASLELLDRGIVRNPGAWDLSYESAMIYLVNRKEQPDSPRMAAAYLALSAATGKAPGIVMQLASKLQGQYNLSDIEREMWENLRKGGDKLLRDLATRKLQELELREVCLLLDQRLAQFAQGAGRPAASLEELAQARLIQAVPPDPLGGKFFLGPDGHVRNTTLLDDAKQQALTVLRNGLDKYKEVHGNWPATLEELVKVGPLTQLPAQPYPGQGWHYTPETGEVN